MADNQNATAKKVSFFKGVKTEFKKIVWPTRKDVAKESVVVVIVTIFLGLLIAVIDLFMNYGIDFWISLGL